MQGKGNAPLVHCWLSRLAVLRAQELLEVVRRGQRLFASEVEIVVSSRSRRARVVREEAMWSGGRTLRATKGSVALPEAVAGETRRLAMR